MLLRLATVAAATMQQRFLAREYEIPKKPNFLLDDMHLMQSSDAATFALDSVLDSVMYSSNGNIGLRHRSGLETVDCTTEILMNGVYHTVPTSNAMDSTLSVKARELGAVVGTVSVDCRIDGVSGTLCSMPLQRLNMRNGSYRNVCQNALSFDAGLYFDTKYTRCVSLSDLSLWGMELVCTNLRFRAPGAAQTEGEFADSNGAHDGQWGAGMHDMGSCHNEGMNHNSNSNTINNCNISNSSSGNNNGNNVNKNSNSHTRHHHHLGNNGAGGSSSKNNGNSSSNNGNNNNSSGNSNYNNASLVSCLGSNSCTASSSYESGFDMGSRSASNGATTVHHSTSTRLSPTVSQTRLPSAQTYKLEMVISFSIELDEWEVSKANRMDEFWQRSFTSHVAVSTTTSASCVAEYRTHCTKLEPEVEYHTDCDEKDSEQPVLTRGRVSSISSHHAGHGGGSSNHTTTTTTTTTTPHRHPHLNSSTTMHPVQAGHFHPMTTTTAASSSAAMMGQPTLYEMPLHGIAGGGVPISGSSLSGDGAAMGSSTGLYFKDPPFHTSGVMATMGGGGGGGGPMAVRRRAAIRTAACRRRRWGEIRAGRATAATGVAVRWVMAARI